MTHNKPIITTVTVIDIIVGVVPFNVYLSSLAIFYCCFPKKYQTGLLVLSDFLNFFSSTIFCDPTEPHGRNMVPGSSESCCLLKGRLLCDH